MMRLPSDQERKMMDDLIPYFDVESDFFKVVDDAPEEIKKEAAEFKRLYIDNSPVPQSWR